MVNGYFSLQVFLFRHLLPPRASIFGRHQEKNLDASSFINIPQPKLLEESIVDGSILRNLGKQHSSISDLETESASCQ